MNNSRDPRSGRLQAGEIRFAARLALCLLSMICLVSGGCASGKSPPPASGTGIATVFVDHNLRILRFTPSATRIINLILTDLGRPVGHILSNLKGYDRLVPDTRAVLDTLIPKEIEVQTTEGGWFTMRIQPYRTLDNVIEGAVLSFVEITEIVLTREALKKANELLRQASIEEIKILKDKKSRKAVGEVIAYFLQEPILPSTFEEILDSVKSQDALLSCPHPFDWPRSNFKRFPKEWKKFDCMEIFNARAYYQGLNKKSEKFAFSESVKGKIACLGVSDAHTPE